MIFRRQQVLSDHLRAWWVITNRYRKPEGEVQAELMSVSHVAIQTAPWSTFWHMTFEP